MERRLDTVSLMALFSVFLSWFLLDTFTVTLGSLQHGVRFYDVPAVIGDPSRMFFVISKTFATFLFAALCLGCLLLPLAVWHRRRWAWLALCAPLILMLICGSLLYFRTSGEFFATPADPSNIRGNVIRFANGLAHRGSGMVARHISMGVGGYLGIAGCVVLTASGLKRRTLLREM